MSDGATHRSLGAAIGAGGYMAYKSSVNEPFTIGDLVMCALGGSLVASLPDILEPADGPNHRGFFHSEAMLTLVALAAKASLSNEDLTNKDKALLGTTLAAYSGHLLQDSETPAGLPSC